MQECSLWVVLCGLYLSGYLYMIKYANDSHDEDLKRDIEKAKRKNFENNEEQLFCLTKYNIWNLIVEAMGHITIKTTCLTKKQKQL